MESRTAVGTNCKFTVNRMVCSQQHRFSLPQLLCLPLFGTRLHRKHVVVETHRRAIKFENVMLLEFRHHVGKGGIHLAVNGRGHVLLDVRFTVGNVIKQVTLLGFQLVLLLDGIVKAYIGRRNVGHRHGAGVGRVHALVGNGKRGGRDLHPTIDLELGKGVGNRRLALNTRQGGEFLAFDAFFATLGLESGDRVENRRGGSTRSAAAASLVFGSLASLGDFLVVGLESGHGGKEKSIQR